MQTTPTDPATTIALSYVISAKAHLKRALASPHDEDGAKNALALLVEAEKVLAKAENPTPAAPETQLVYGHVPLFSRWLDRDRLATARPDGLLAFTPASNAPVLLVQFALDDVPASAFITLRGAATLRDALTAMIHEAASVDMAEAAAAPEAAR